MPGVYHPVGRRPEVLTNVWALSFLQKVRPWRDLIPGLLTHIFFWRLLYVQKAWGGCTHSRNARHVQAWCRSLQQLIAASLSELVRPTSSATLASTSHCLAWLALPDCKFWQDRAAVKCLKKSRQEEALPLKLGVRCPNMQPVTRGNGVGFRTFWGPSHDAFFSKHCSHTSVSEVVAAQFDDPAKI